MDILFQNFTQYDKSAICAANWVVSRTTRKTAFRLRRALFLTLGICALLVGCLMMLLYRELRVWEKELAAGFLLIGVLAMGEGIFLRRITAWSSRRSMIDGRTDHLYTFSQEEVTVEIPDLGRSIYPYSSFFCSL